MKKLGIDFYQQKDVVQIAKKLMGKILVTEFDGNVTSGRIIETEAYNGVADKACHAFGGRRTKRTNIMYMPGGTMYVYLCYGLHHLCNVVTNVANVPDAVLIRSVVGMAGIDTMLQRLGKTALKNDVLKGPGVVSKGLGITTAQTGNSLLYDNIFISDDGQDTPPENIITTPRIGVAYAGADALLPYRFMDTRFLR